MRWPKGFEDASDAAPDSEGTAQSLSTLTGSRVSPFSRKIHPRSLA
jgi:hypothetical protein